MPSAIKQAFVQSCLRGRNSIHRPSERSARGSNRAAQDLQFRLCRQRHPLKCEAILASLCLFACAGNVDDEVVVADAPQALTAVQQVNCGGGAVGPFVADQYSAGGNTFSSGNAIATTGVTNAAPAAVYQTERFGSHAYTFGNLTPNASYTVRLHFAEVYFTSAGSRRFNVVINGTQVLTNLDIFATVGANKALVRDFTANASSAGQIAIQYVNVVENAKSSAIEIWSSSGATNQAPTVAAAASGNPNPATGTTSNLSVLGADDGGESALIYNWSTSGTPPGSVSFSVNGSNAAKNTTATFGSAGAYTLSASIRDAGGLSVTSSVNITVNSSSSGQTILFDDFLGSSLDTTKWTLFDRISDQSNGEINCCVPGNVTVSGGLLLGASTFEDHSCGDSQQAPVTEHYTSWQIQQKTAPFLYGTVQVRAKLPGGTGIWPDIWMLGYKWQSSQPATANIPGANWPSDGWCEIDIAEFWQNARSRMNCTVHFNTPGGLHEQPLPFDATSRYMVYRLQWSKNSLIWSVDAEDGAGFRTLRTVTGAGNVPDVAMYLVINAAVGGSGGGTPNPSTFPQTFSVDWVRVTQ